MSQILFLYGVILYKVCNNNLRGQVELNDRPYVILAMPFNLILSSNHLNYRNTQCFYGNVS